MPTRHRDEAFEEMPAGFGWRGRLTGAIFFALGVVGYLGDVIPYETKHHAAEAESRRTQEFEFLRGVVNRHADLLDELLRNQIRVLERLELEPMPRRRDR